MGKWVNTAAAVLVAVIGVVWKYPVQALDWIGRAFDVLELSALNNKLVDFLQAHPDLANDIGPLVLIWGGIGSLALTHVAPPLYRMWKQSPLEIIYDPADREGRFGGVGMWYLHNSDDPPFSAFIFRVGVKNMTRKTIYNVGGTIEGGIIPSPFPLRMRNSLTRELNTDLHPDSMILMDVFALDPRQENWSVPEGIHKIIVRVTGKDTPETMQEFLFDKSRMPAMYTAES